MIFIGRFFYLPFLFLKYTFRRTYQDTSGTKQRLDNPKRFRLLLEELGGVYVKFGKILAMRFDLLPTPYATELLYLQNRVSPKLTAEMFDVYYSETGRTITEVFGTIEKEPFRTSSFAQSYQATFQGQKVVVKIQKPHIKNYITADLIVLKFLFTFIDEVGFFKTVSLKEAIMQLKEWLRNELDYTHEAHNNQVILEHLKHHSIENVQVPTVYTNLSSEKILVREFLTGSSVERIITNLATRPDDVERILAERNIDLLTSANLFIHDFIRQYFVDGFFLADPLPNALAILPENHIGYINFDILGRKDHSSPGLLKFFKASAEFDFYEAAVGIASLIDERFRKDFGDLLRNDSEMNGQYEKMIAFITDRLSEDFASIIKDWHSTVSSKDLSTLERSSAVMFLKILKAIRNYKSNLPQDVIAFMRAFFVLEIICLKLTPDFQIVKAIQASFDRASIDEIQVKAATHIEETSNLHEFEGLRLVDIAPEIIGEEVMKAEEKRAIKKERFKNILTALAEKYPEFYNELRS